MQQATKRSLKRFLIYLSAFLVFLFIFLVVVAERYVEPVLKDRLHTLIIQGSDSLYTYRLGDLDASFFGGSVEINDLEVTVDSSRYIHLKQRNALPSLTMQFYMERGYIKGVAVFSLLFNKKVKVNEIYTEDANIRLIREERNKEGSASVNKTPLWKRIHPYIKVIDVDRIKLDGIKLLYKSRDTAESMKLQFDTCYAQFDNVRIDSIAANEVDRIGFTKEISLRFRDLKFRTPDSTMKMKAEEINYSSRNKTLEVVDFKIQPTLKEKEDFYRAIGRQESMHVITFERTRLTNFQVEKFVHNDIVAADSVLIDRPDINIYVDKTYPPTLKSRIGKYPHQNLLNSSQLIQIKGMAIRNADLRYTEKGRKSLQEGTLTLSNLNVTVSNITNDSMLIMKAPRCVVRMQGTILGNSPLDAQFTFYLDSANGRFDVHGTVENVNAAQLNALAEPLGNTKLQSFNMHFLRFDLSGDDNTARGKVQMKYSNLFVVLQKREEETGSLSAKRFLTKLINRYTLHDSNPGHDGVERVADPVIRARLTSQSLFGLVWKTIFTGMQQVMVKSGRYEE